MRKHMIKAIKFMLKYPNTWHGYASDKLTVSIICALVNLGIAEINEYEQFMLKSEFKAHQFLNN